MGDYPDSAFQWDFLKISLALDHDRPGEISGQAIHFDMPRLSDHYRKIAEPDESSELFVRVSHQWTRSVGQQPAAPSRANPTSHRVIEDGYALLLSEDDESRLVQALAEGAGLVLDSADGTRILEVVYSD